MTARPVAGPQDAAWPIGDAPFPELIASRHRYGNENIWVTATTGLSAQRMAGVEQYLDVPDGATRIELAIARHSPDQAGAEILGALATIPLMPAGGLAEFLPGHSYRATVTMTTRRRSRNSVQIMPLLLRYRLRGTDQRVSDTACAAAGIRQSRQDRCGRGNARVERAHH